MKHTKRDDPKAIAVLARVESHLADARRRAIWKDDQAGYEMFDAALSDVRTVSRLVRLAATESWQRVREQKATARLTAELAKAA